MGLRIPKARKEVQSTVTSPVYDRTRVNPASFGGTQAKQLAQAGKAVGDVLGSVAEVSKAVGAYQKLKNDNIAGEVFNTYSDKARKIYSSLSSAKGMEAYDIDEKAIKEFDKLEVEALSGLENDAQKNRFKAMFRDRTNAYKERISNYMIKEVADHTKRTSLALNENFKNDAIINPTPVNITKNMALTAANIYKVYLPQGEEIAKQKLRQAQSNLLLGVTKSLVNQDPAEADKFMDSEINGVKVTKLIENGDQVKNQIQNVANLQISKNTATMIASSGGSLTDQLNQVDILSQKGKLTAEVASDTKKELRLQFQEQEIAQQEARNKNLNDILTYLEEDPSRTVTTAQIDQDAWGDETYIGLKKARALQNAFIQGSRKKSDIPTYQKLEEMGDKLVSYNLVKDLDKLDETDAKYFIKKQAKLKEGKQIISPKALATFRISRDPDFKLTAGKKQRERTQRFYEQLERRVNTELTPDERTNIEKVGAIINDMLTKANEPPAGIWPSTWNYLDKRKFELPYIQDEEDRQKFFEANLPETLKKYDINTVQFKPGQEMYYVYGKEGLILRYDKYGNYLNRGYDTEEAKNQYARQ